MKNVLIYGLGVTGISSAKALFNLGYKVYLLDQKYSKGDLVEGLEETEYEILNQKDLFSVDLDFIVKSPGILNTNEIVVKASKRGIESLSDMEVAYRLWGGDNIIAVTGTNGKTTTVSLIGHLLDCANIKNRVIGNIGVGVLWEMYIHGKEYTYVMECSSFQLSNIKEFKPSIACILNISPDHLNWHKDLDEYINAKRNIYRKQDSNDYLVLNYDDNYLRNIKDFNSKLISISTKEKTDGVYAIDDDIYYKEELVVNRNDISIPGEHNLSNALFAIAIAKILGIDKETLREGLKTFKAVEHRLEFVREINEMKVYNDSKATNEDSTIKAIESFNNPIILIAGGVDKKVKFDELFHNKPNIKALILMGENRKILEEAALKSGIKKIYMVKDLKESVEKALEVGEKGDTILLSPASASFDMFKSFEDRGEKFKKIINNL